MAVTYVCHHISQSKLLSGFHSLVVRLESVTPRRVRVIQVLMEPDMMFSTLFLHVRHLIFLIKNSVRVPWTDYVRSTFTSKRPTHSNGLPSIESSVSVNSDLKMDESSESSSFATQAGYSTVCKCRRSFAQLNAYANHQCTCKKRKKYLSNALAKAKEVWTARKRPCKEDERDEPAHSHPPTWYDLDTATPSQALSIGSEQAFIDGTELNSGSGSDLAVAGVAGVEVDRNVSVISNVENLPCG